MLNRVVLDSSFVCSRTSSTSTVFGTGGTVVNIENWKCSHVLRGHLGGN